MIDDFRRWGFDTRGWGRRTRYVYGLIIQAADRWTRANRSKPLWRCDHDDLQAWIATKSPSAAYRNRLRHTLIAYFCYLIDKGRRKTNPARDLPRLRESRPVPRALTGDAPRRVMQAAEAYSPMWHAFCALLFYAGLRRDEARTLTWSCIRDDSVIFRAKGNVEREVWLHPTVRDALATWRAQCRDPEWVFPSPRYAGQPLSASTVASHLAAIGRLAQVEHLHPHRGRHTFARRMIDMGVPVPHVKEALGHASLASTQVYVAAGGREVQQAIARIDY